jgi:hypothetical protein
MLVRIQFGQPGFRVQGELAMFSLSKERPATGRIALNGNSYLLDRSKL